MRRGLWALLFVAGFCGLAGCGAGGGGGGGVLNQLDRLPDEDGDMFSEIEPPEGVEMDLDETVALHIKNTITRSQAVAASGVQLSDFVSSNVSLSARVAVDLTYADGITQTLPGRFPVAPFELQFEIACPERIEVLVTVVASAPLVGSQPVSTFGPYVFTQGEGEYAFECGSTVTLETYADEETGELIVDVSVE